MNANEPTSDCDTQTPNNDPPLPDWFEKVNEEMLREVQERVCRRAGELVDELLPSVAKTIFSKGISDSDRIEAMDLFVKLQAQRSSDRPDPEVTHRLIVSIKSVIYVTPNGNRFLRREEIERCFVDCNLTSDRIKQAIDNLDGKANL
jgi:hypothetical protein